MNAKEWEAKYRYNNRHCCACCVYFEKNYTKNLKPSFRCQKRREAGVGEKININYSCDLWEDEKK